ncbi:MAG TPA: conjugative transposon protein TraN [Prolixibacteraceae bacterium]|nr:conjugative transposon protein TraN [Prolixibacteraceae bacterium]
MKSFLIIFIFAIFQISVSAQNILKVSDTKTSHLVCPDKVKYVQAGDYSIIQAEVVPELTNMIRIKAVQPFDKPTSLTVVCADRIYSFELQYGNDAPITYPIETFDSQKAMTFSGKMMPDYLLKDLCDQVLDQHRHQFRKRKTEKDGIKIRLNSINLKNDALFFEFQITNKTNMAYDVESFNFWITDKRQTKATNVQEYQVFPDYQQNKVQRIPGKTTVREVFVIEKMTIPDQRILKIELNEKALGNTGRKLTFNLKNKDILKARPLKQQ